MTGEALQSRIETGVSGADDVLHGGMLEGSATLIRGAPGAGKTIFGLHYATTTRDPDATNLYINLGEPSSYLGRTAEAFELPTDRVEFLDLSPSGDQFRRSESYDLFSADEVETPSLVASIREQVESHSPERVVIDPITELRYLAPDERQFRTQVLSLLDFLKDSGTTVLLTSQAAESIVDDDLQFLVDSVLELDLRADRRTLSVSKFRGSGARRGRHTVTIGGDGMCVWPRLDPSKHEREGELNTLSSGVPDLDALLGGGVTTGTITFLSGPTGVGKTTTGMQFMKEAAKNGDRSVLYSFEEAERTMLDRADAIGIPAREMISDGNLVIEEISPEALTIDEFTHRIRSEIEDEGAEIVMIDGVSGFERAFRGLEDDPESHLVNIGRYLRNMNVTGLVTNEVHGITGEFRATERNVSHLADSIVVFRHVEYRGELRKVIGMLKRRTGDFQHGLRIFEITEDGLHLGEQPSDLRGILTGTPEW